MLLDYEPTLDPWENQKYYLNLAGKFFTLSMDIVTIANEISKDQD